MAAIPEDTQALLELERMRSNNNKLSAEIEKLIAETAQIQRHTWWYPVVIAGGIMGGTATLVGALAAIAFKLFVPDAPTAP